MLQALNLQRLLKLVDLPARRRDGGGGIVEYDAPLPLLQQLVPAEPELPQRRRRLGWHAVGELRHDNNAGVLFGLKVPPALPLPAGDLILVLCLTGDPEKARIQGGRRQMVDLCLYDQPAKLYELPRPLLALRRLQPRLFLFGQRLLPRRPFELFREREPCHRALPFGGR